MNWEATTQSERGVCRVCGATGIGSLFSAPDLLCGVPGTFEYSACHGCGSVSAEHAREASASVDYYPAEYWQTLTPALDAIPRAAGTSARHLAALRDLVRGEIRAATLGNRSAGAGGALFRGLARIRTLRERAFFNAVLAECLPWGKEGRALDVGCGPGLQMAALARVGWEVAGLERDEDQATAVAARLGCSVVVGDIETTSLGEPRFDLVLFHHVIEHVTSVRKALSRAVQVLKPGGRLALVWPNPHSLGARAYGSAWIGWDVPRHLALPSLDAAARTCGGMGLRILSARTVARHAAAFSFFSRGLRARRRVWIGLPTPGRTDHIFQLGERLLVGLGIHCGEEAVLLAEKPSNAQLSAES